MILSQNAVMRLYSRTKLLVIVHTSEVPGCALESSTYLVGMLDRLHFAK